MASRTEQTHTAILGRAISSAGPACSEASRSILGIKLASEDDLRRVLLAEKARVGTLTPCEEGELDSYRHVGRILELVKCKARSSLKGRVLPPT